MGEVGSGDAGIVGIDRHLDTLVQIGFQRINWVITGFRQIIVPVSDNLKIAGRTHFNGDVPVDHPFHQLPVVHQGQSMPDALGIQMINRLPDAGYIHILTGMNGDVQAFFHQGQQMVPNLPRRTCGFVSGQVKTSQSGKSIGPVQKQRGQIGHVGDVRSVSMPAWLSG